MELECLSFSLEAVRLRSRLFCFFCCDFSRPFSRLVDLSRSRSREREERDLERERERDFDRDRRERERERDRDVSRSRCFFSFLLLLRCCFSLVFSPCSFSSFSSLSFSSFSFFPPILLALLAARPLEPSKPFPEFLWAIFHSVWQLWLLIRLLLFSTRSICVKTSRWPSPRSLRHHRNLDCSGLRCMSLLSAKSLSICLKQPEYNDSMKCRSVCLFQSGHMPLMHLKSSGVWQMRRQKSQLPS